MKAAHPSGNSVYERDWLRKCESLQFIVLMSVNPSVNKQHMRVLEKIIRTYA